MSFSWTPHRFSGGALALDIANSVILRGDAARSTDRFAVPAQLADFAAAAGRYCGESELPLPLLPVPLENVARFLALREAVDACFRDRAAGGSDPLLLANLLEAIAGNLRHAASPRALDAAAARSALRLTGECLDGGGRLKVCANCGWLFLDRSRNRSRIWCDMTVCGNRAKASRHYRKVREGGS